MKAVMDSRLIRYLLYMISVSWTLLKDLIRKEMLFEEVKTNYLLGKANACERANLLRRAIRVYEDLLRKNQKSVPVFINLGGLYYRRGMYAAAAPYYERVIRLNPKHYQGHYWLAMCYFKLDRYYGAMNTLEEVIEFLPTFKDALNLMGECYEKIGEGAKAEHYYLKAISTDPKGILVLRTPLTSQVPAQREGERIKH